MNKKEIHLVVNKLDVKAIFITAINEVFTRHGETYKKAAQALSDNVHLGSKEDILHYVEGIIKTHEDVLRELKDLKPLVAELESNPSIGTDT